jgi:polygalacturonase
MDFEVRQSGAISDGRSMDAASLQAAIDHCSAAGGGRLVLPKGDYLTGTL